MLSDSLGKEDDIIFDSVANTYKIPDIVMDSF
jgi:hypothetical protein